MSAVRRFRTTPISLASLAALVLVPATSATAGAVASAHPDHRGTVVHSRGYLTDLQLAVADPTDGVRAQATAVTGRGRTLVVLKVRGFDPSSAGRTFGAHVHSGACVEGDGAAAGPHYNSTGVPPVEISEDTEVWLDFTVGRKGWASAVALVPFDIPAGAAGAIVVHQEETAPGTGVAGPRLACLPMGF
jgi:hypothetical protein